MGKLDNPVLLFGKTTRFPYVILFTDNLGTSPLGGGTTCIYGYSYEDGDFGAQLAIKYDLSLPRYRNRNAIWSEWKELASDHDKLNFIGYLGPQAEASSYLLYPLYHDKFAAPSNNPNWLPYTFFGSNDLIIGYETSNDYGMQIKMPHGESKNYKRTRTGSKTWSDWVAL